MKRVPYKRRREQKTDYRKRLRLVISGKTRLVVRISNKYINCQFIDYEPDGDLTRISFNSKELNDYGFKGGKNLQSAYLSGLKAGKMALEAGIKEAILDIGLNRSIKNSRLYAALKGAVEAGIKIPHDAVILPSDELLKKNELTKVIDNVKNKTVKKTSKTPDKKVAAKKAKPDKKEVKK